jgi:hypothetical protein
MSIIDQDVTITQQKYENTILLLLLTIPCIGKASTRCDLIWIFRASRLPAKSIHTYTAWTWLHNTSSEFVALQSTTPLEEIHSHRWTVCWEFGTTMQARTRTDYEGELPSALFFFLWWNIPVMLGSMKLFFNRALLFFWCPLLFSLALGAEALCTEWDGASSSDVAPTGGT